MLEDHSKHLKKEKQKAQELRRSRWWQTIIQTATCYYCSSILDAKKATMDHIIPISSGGHSDKNNVVPCCKTCNNLKKHLNPVEWSELQLKMKKIP